MGGDLLLPIHMNSNLVNRLVLAFVRRQALPIATYPGMVLAGATVRDVVSDAQVQFEIQAALHQRHQTPFVLTAMDLSAEAEAFGCEIFQPENEIPSVTGRLVTSREQADNLPVPAPGDGRTRVYLEAAGRLRQMADHPLVLGGCIGPFSLASRIVGVKEAMELTVLEPDLIHVVVEKCTRFLGAYIQAFREAGADGVIMAEPAAGLLSPRSLSQFSSAYIRQIAATVADGRFAFILHNCAARIVHLPAILETGLSTFHFGAPMDLAAALGKVPRDVVLCGNLDPAAVFCHTTPADMAAHTQALLAATAAFPNFVISSGCDVPPDSPLANLDAFYGAVRAFNSTRADEPRTEVVLPIPGSGAHLPRSS
jgi:uroporphyrinogen decarboxylase